MLVTFKGTYASEDSNEYSGSVTIPSTIAVDGVINSVTSIGDDIFGYCSGLISVIMRQSHPLPGGQYYE